MNINEFDLLDINKKANILFSEGEYCGVRAYYNYKINLYSLSDFFVEVYYSPDNNEIEKIEIVKDDKILDRFIDSMLDINNQLNNKNL